MLGISGSILWHTGGWTDDTTVQFGHKSKLAATLLMFSWPFWTPSPLPSPWPHHDYNTRLLPVWGGVEQQPNRNSLKIDVDQGNREENKEQKVWLAEALFHGSVWYYCVERQSSGQSYVESGPLVSGLGWLCGCNYINYVVFFPSPAFPLCTQL